MIEPNKINNEYGGIVFIKLKYFLFKYLLGAKHSNIIRQIGSKYS